MPLDLSKVISVQTKNGYKLWPYETIRYMGIFLSIAAFAVTIIVGVYTLSLASSPNLYAFSTNTFLQTHIRGSKEYTWVSWDTANPSVDFWQCTKNAKIFDNRDTCKSNLNITEYTNCVKDKYPNMFTCISSRTLGTPPNSIISLSQLMLGCFYSDMTNPSGLSPSMSDYSVPSIDVSDFQLDIIQKCLTPD
jgi:hypothetical protein